MKKLITLILALALAASLFVGCGEKTPDVPNNEPTVSTTGTAEPTDAPDPTDAPETNDPTVAPTEDQTTDETPEDETVSKPQNKPHTNKNALITELHRVIVDGRCVLSVPQINLDSADAKRINQEIEESYKEAVEYYMEDADAVNYNGYTSWRIERSSDHSFALIIIDDDPKGFYYYTVYNFDSTTGKELTNAEVLEIAGLTQADFDKLVRTRIEEYFQEAYSDAMEEMADELLEETLTYDYWSWWGEPRVYINSNNELRVIRPVAGAAGPGYFEADLFVKDVDSKLVTEYVNVRGNVKDAAEEDPYYSYNIPQLNFDSTDAKRINQEIQEEHGKFVDMVQNPGKDFDIYSTPQEISWTLDRNGDVISLLLISQARIEDFVNYDVYNFNVKTGKEVTDAEILALAGLTEGEFKDLANKRADEFFCEKYEAYKSIPAAEFDVCREDNLKSFTTIYGVYLSTNNELNMIRRVAAIAGADGYYHVIVVK